MTTAEEIMRTALTQIRDENWAPKLTAIAAAALSAADAHEEIMRTALTPLQELLDWCQQEREKLGAVDGYDYRSGEEYGLRRAQIEIGKRSAAPASGVTRTGSASDNLLYKSPREAESLREWVKAAAPATERTIKLTDPAIIIAGIRKFGLAPDGSDLRDLEAALMRIATAPAHSEYDSELGRITEQDREYAGAMLDDFTDEWTRLECAAQWLRRVRYEAVMADRKRSAAPASGVTEEEIAKAVIGCKSPTEVARAVLALIRGEGK
jgi:hypothetical protein